MQPVFIPAAAAQTGDAQAETAQTAGTPSKLFIRVNDENEGKLSRAESLVRIFIGQTPVILYDGRTKEQRRLSGTVSGDPLLLSELQRLMGEENVVLRRRQ